MCSTSVVLGGCVLGGKEHRGGDRTPRALGFVSMFRFATCYSAVLTVYNVAGVQSVLMFLQQ
jgi:hypothetical protein